MGIKAVQTLTTAAAIVTVAAVTAVVAPLALASPECLSKREARAKWPQRHLYWHTSDRCWDTHRGGNRYRHKPGQIRDYIPPDEKRARASADPAEDVALPETKRAGRSAALPVIQPPLKPPEWKVAGPDILFPPLIVNHDATVTYLEPTVSTGWKPLFDIDEDTTGLPRPDLEHNVDGCCWPDMRTLPPPKHTRHK